MARSFVRLSGKQSSAMCASALLPMSLLSEPTSLTSMTSSFGTA